MQYAHIARFFWYKKGVIDAKKITLSKKSYTLKKGKTVKIKAKKKGSCIIYVYARNGLAKKIKVKVK